MAFEEKAGALLFGLSVLTSLALAHVKVRRSSSNEVVKQCDSKTSSKIGVVVVKLGGSSITNKSVFESLNEEALRTTALHVSQALVASPDTKLILVHGAGSFGHFTAKQFELSSGGKEDTWRHGLCVTRNSVTKLNSYVVAALSSQNVQAVALPLFPATRTRGKITVAEAGNLGKIDAILEQGLVPVIHGDVVLDEEQRCTIFSGDRILTHLTCSQGSSSSSSSSKIKRAVFLTDVQGVLTLPPSDPGAQLIPIIKVRQDGSLLLPKLTTSMHQHDVTGGIVKKLESAAQMALAGVVVFIVQAGTEHALKALKGETPDICTVIYKTLDL